MLERFSDAARVKREYQFVVTECFFFNFIVNFEIMMSNCYLLLSYRKIVGNVQLLYMYCKWLFVMSPHVLCTNC